jgi:hypothetical protein
MDVQEILQQFATNTGAFPREAVAQAIAQRETITPELLRVLTEAQHNIEHLLDSDSMAHIYAMYLLGAALRGLVTLVACGEQSRDDIITYVQRLYRGGLARDGSFVWSGLVSVSNDLYPAELYDDIKHAYNDDLIEPFFIRLADIDATLKRGKERVLDELHHNRHYSLITDTITEMEWWACFHPERQAVPHSVSEAHPRVELAQQKAKDKRKRKLAKAARRRNRR